MGHRRRSSGGGKEREGQGTPLGTGRVARDGLERRLRELRLLAVSVSGVGVSPVREGRVCGVGELRGLEVKLWGRGC